MTRAREHLIISSGPSTQRTTGSFVAILDEAYQKSHHRRRATTIVAIGPAKLEFEWSRRLASRRPGRAKSQNPTTDEKTNWQPYVDTWARRRSAYEAAIKTPVFVTPTLLKQQEQEMAETCRTQCHGFHTVARLPCSLEN